VVILSHGFAGEARLQLKLDRIHERLRLMRYFRFARADLAKGCHKSGHFGAPELVRFLTVEVAKGRCASADVGCAAMRRELKEGHVYSSNWNDSY